MSQAEPETIESLNQAIALHPDDAKTRARRGETYRLMGRYEEALADFNWVIELKPDYAWAHFYHGPVYCLMNCDFRSRARSLSRSRATGFRTPRFRAFGGSKTPRTGCLIILDNGFELDELITQKPC